ncbi:MAG: ROK family protein [Clostridiales bacterium]|nr:ROK family protein [Clostridiales bacterium]MDD7035624.1 ROK family protein [Bacillota bacterium]MDY2920225.1 ROK family protein [Lentihominibacter sp.]
MNYLGIEVNVKNMPPLDSEFIPMGVWMKEYEKEATRPVGISVEREEGKITRFETALRGEEFEAANLRYLERYIKFCLWSVGGWKVSVCGCDEEAAKVKADYMRGSARDFDVEFMMNTYERDFVFEICDPAEMPEANDADKSVGGHLEGCRIGFDAGGSDRKVSAVIDGETVYSEEVVWHPKLSEDISYQYNGIVDSLKTAASKMPRVDAIGVSTAGVLIGNAPMVSSIFLKISRDDWDQVKTVYERAAAEIGDVPIVVANDGDVTALAGAMSMDMAPVLGIAMGTSEAGGYVNAEKNVLGWFNELAFAPVDLNEEAMADPWSGDRGVGATYFSQDCVIKLAPAAGIQLDESLAPAEKLKVVQDILHGEKGSEKEREGARQIFLSIGAYLAHTLILYGMYYDLKNVLILGRVASGEGGEIMVSECNRVLSDEYPEFAAGLKVMLPDEKMRRVGQSVAAASLPEIK